MSYFGVIGALEGQVYCHSGGQVIGKKGGGLPEIVPKREIAENKKRKEKRVDLPTPLHNYVVRTSAV